MSGPPSGPRGDFNNAAQHQHQHHQQQQQQQYTQEQYYAILQQQQASLLNGNNNNNNQQHLQAIHPQQLQGSTQLQSGAGGGGGSGGPTSSSGKQMNHSNNNSDGGNASSSNSNIKSNTSSTKQRKNSMDGSGNGDDSKDGNGNAATKDGQQAKFSRSKGACQQCRAVKQRCSGAAKHPCERCQLYKLECVFSKDPPPPKDPAKQPVKKAAAKQASIDPEAGAAVLHSLRAITERLRTIEDQIAAQNKSLGNMTISGPSTSGDAHLAGNAFGFDADMKPNRGTPMGNDGNASMDGNQGDLHHDPVSTVSSAIKDLDQMLSNVGSKVHMAKTSASSSPNSLLSGHAAGSERGSSPRASGSMFGPSGASGSQDAKDKKILYEPDVPDAISRGFVTVEEAQQLFDFYFSRCAQWTPPLDPHNDRNMYHVRRRSTFLFHSILAVASYFCYVPQGENGLRKYYAIVTTLVESLAPIVICPNPAELTVDLLMGLLICILWKPVRCGSAMQLGPAGFSDLQAQSKINPSSGYVLGGLALRIAQLLSLSRKASNLASPSNDKETINACRLWLWINLIDSQNALAEGKQPALDASDALRSTRLFASFKNKPGDVRLAAMVELYAAVVPIVAMHHGAQKTDFRALYRANSVLDKLSAYWNPRIEEAYRAGDQLAGTFSNIFVPFVRLVLNADVFRTWLIRQKQASKDGEIDTDHARESLTSEEAHCIGFAVQAAEEMLYYLSSQSKAEGAARNHDWAPREITSGHRPPLNLDPEIGKQLAGSIDQVLLVVFAFPPLFLAQLRASNLVNCDLDMAPEITNDLWSVGFPAKSILPASKFMRLMELSAEFYEATAPNRDFPSIEQATLLRSIACLSVPLDGPAPPQYQGNHAGVAQMEGAACAVPGFSGSDQVMNWDPLQGSKAHQEYMQQIASSLPGTNPNLGYPYNNMVFSNDGADRLESLLQSNVADPTSSTSLLGSFAKIDADWNAYFSPPSMGGSSNYTFPDNGNGVNMGNGLVNNQNLNYGTAPSMQNLPRMAGQSPDSNHSLFSGNGFNVTNSPVSVGYGHQTARSRQY
ncbi:hypothetical protein P389DRAFT_71166 [Cystobasidium minutum MCA 4210]|uniref:uncharacterized protein n=1 Tax=Cystobasidium minutum MCA 4210 TaxID=1397322 RepID=UPI0034CD164A|eukprot:jgi/Rhomi1/71166/CE71165_3176